jgi:hypothetical protein
VKGKDWRFFTHTGERCRWLREHTYEPEERVRKQEEKVDEKK